MKRLGKEIVAFILMVIIMGLAVVDTIINVVYLLLSLIRQGFETLTNWLCTKVAPVYRGREGYQKVIKEITK